MRKIILNKKRGINNINEDINVKINLTSSLKEIPTDQITNVISADEQFNKERSSSNLYRFIFNITPIFSNVLINNTGDRSYETFNDMTFRDTSFPTDGEAELTYEESVKNNIELIDGWVKYKNPDSEEGKICEYIEMEPSSKELTLVPKNGADNWDVMITYPKNNNYDNYLIKGGILLVTSEEEEFNSEMVTTIYSVINHNLKSGDKVKIKISENIEEIVTVLKVGKLNGDDKEYCFSVNLENELQVESRFIKFNYDREVVYYAREFAKVKTQLGDTLDDYDYDRYNLGFSNSIYEDRNNQIIFNEDIDLSGLEDNLGRPLLEVFLTFIKHDNREVFTNTKSGVDIPFKEEVNGNIKIHDARRITHENSSHDAINENVLISDDVFFGDICEYDPHKLEEIVLADALHGFNSNLRLTTKTIDSITLNPRPEGYMYYPHHRIQLKQLSNYIEEGLKSDINTPSYAVLGSKGKFRWRDIIDVGLSNGVDERLNYPFLNGSHYIEKNINLSLLRQDPFGLYGLRYTAFPNDFLGDELFDDYKINKRDDAC
jgi:hypothetical protein